MGKILLWLQERVKHGTRSAEKLIQRCLQHILPHHFVKVRYHGFFAATQRSKLTALQKQLTSHTLPAPVDEIHQETTTPPLCTKSCARSVANPCFTNMNYPPSACRSP